MPAFLFLFLLLLISSLLKDKFLRFQANQPRGLVRPFLHFYVISTIILRMAENLFLSQPEQHKLSEARVLIAGCGVGSWTAEFLVRSGIGVEGGILLADPGRVNRRNIQRQNYTVGDLGVRKPVALDQRLRAINPGVNTRFFLGGVFANNVEDVCDGCDVIIDAIDISRPGDEIVLHREAQKRNIPVVTGFDIGYGARTYIFDYRNPEAMTLCGLWGLSDDITPDSVQKLPYLALVAQVLLGPVGRLFDNFTQVQSYYDRLVDERMRDILIQLPKEMHTVVQRLRTGELDYTPQTLIAATTHGAMQATIVKDLILGKPVVTAPEFREIHIPGQISS